MRFWVFIASGSDSYDWYLNCARGEGCWCHRQGKGSGFRQISLGDQAIFYVAGRKQFVAYARVTGFCSSPPYPYCHSQRLLLADFHPFAAPVDLKSARMDADFPGTPRGSYRPVKKEVFEKIIQMSGNGDPTSYYLFNLESEMERFILSNWDRLDFFRDHILYKDPAGKTGHQMKLSDSSRPDILCRHRITGDFMVVELKLKASASDVDQVSRYVEEVEEKLAMGSCRVRAAILAQSFEPDVLNCRHPHIDFIRMDLSLSMNHI
jgi:hypothetical protein